MVLSAWYGVITHWVFSTNPSCEGFLTKVLIKSWNKVALNLSRKLWKPFHSSAQSGWNAWQKAQLQAQSETIWACRQQLVRGKGRRHSSILQLGSLQEPCRSCGTSRAVNHLQGLRAIVWKVVVQTAQLTPWVGNWSCWWRARQPSGLRATSACWGSPHRLVRRLPGVQGHPVCYSQAKEVVLLVPCVGH